MVLWLYGFVVVSVCGVCGGVCGGVWWVGCGVVGCGGCVVCGCMGLLWCVVVRAVCVRES